MAVIAAYFFYQGKSSISPDDFGSVDILAVNLMSIVITVYMFRMISRRDWSG
jgi:hypothetical protein